MNRVTPMRERRGALCGVLALTLLIASSWDGAVRAADDANPCALPGYSGDEEEGLGGTGLGGEPHDQSKRNPMSL